MQQNYIKNIIINKNYEAIVTLKSIKKLLKEKNNDYSLIEPFISFSPIPTSIIIPTYNNPEELKVVLKSIIENKSIKNFPHVFEIIIIDDSDNLLVKNITNKIESRVDVFYYRFKNRKRRSRSKARNKGIELSKKELLLFLDSDSVIPNNYFEEIWKIHNKCDCAVVIGLAEKVRLNSFEIKERLPDISKDFRIQTSIMNQEYFIMKDTRWLKDFGYYKQIGILTLPMMITTHNLSVKKKKAIEVNGFDERFVSWGFEDTHFGAKLIALGCFIIPLKNSGIWRIKENFNKKFSNENEKLYESLLDEPIISKVNELEEWQKIRLKYSSIEKIKKKFPQFMNEITSAFVFDESFNFEENLELIKSRLNIGNKDLIIKEFLKELEYLNNKKYGSDSFFNHHQTERSNWKSKTEKIIKLASIKESDNVLVVGVNDGEEIKYFEGSIVGIDLSENAIKRASLKFPDKKFFVGNSNELYFPNSSFNVYISLRTFSVTGVLPEKSIKEAFRVLRKNGSIILSIALWDKKLRSLGQIKFENLSEDSKKIAKVFERYFEKIKYYRINSEEFMIGKKI